jgi:dipeptidyl aminopeptidase/acylaminoacyl peptidase
MMIKQLGRLLAGAGLTVAASALYAADDKPAAAVDPRAVVAAEVFATLPRFQTPKLSPDGTRLAAKLAVKGKQMLVVMSLFDATIPPATIQTRNEDDLNWWRWVGDKWLAIGIGAKQDLYGTEVYVTRTAGVSADMKTFNRIDNWNRTGIRADDVLWAARDGTPRILLARQTGIESMEELYPEVVEADLSTGKVKRVAAGRPNVYDWYADGAGTLRMGYRFDDDRGTGALIYRSTNDESFKTIARKKRSDDRGFAVPVVFRPDGTALAIDDADGRDALYEMTLPDLKLGKRVFGHDRYDIDSVMPNIVADGVAGIAVTEHGSKMAWLDERLKLLQSQMDAAVPGRSARIVTWNADRTRLLVEVGSPSQAGALYFWNTEAGSMQHFAWQNDALRARRLSPVSTVSYTARDGTAIEAILTLPRHRAAKDLPLIVLPHGGPFARDSESWDWWTQYLAETGYAVIQPNYRGSSGYGRDFARKGEGEWGLKMQDDLDDAIGWAVKAGIADGKRVCMIGASYGGYAAMRAAQRGGGLYRCAVSYAGVSDLGALKRYDSQFLNGKTIGNWLQKQAPDLKSVSPRFGAAAFSIPVLLIHGKEDRRVPVQQSRMMAAALKAAGKPHDYVEQPLADHFFTRSEDRLDFLLRMRAFLDRHNPA